jgi:hypothetical protein
MPFSDATRAHGLGFPTLGSQSARKPKDISNPTQLS